MEHPRYQLHLDKTSALRHGLFVCFRTILPLLVRLSRLQFREPGRLAYITRVAPEESMCGGASGWDDNGTNSAHMPHIASKADPLLPMFGFRSVDEPHSRKRTFCLFGFLSCRLHFVIALSLKPFW